MGVVAVVGWFFLFFFLVTVTFLERNGPYVLKILHRSHTELRLRLRLLPHPQDVHLSLIWRPRMNQEDITKGLVVFGHVEIEYKCLFKGTS